MPLLQIGDRIQAYHMGDPCGIIKITIVTETIASSGVHRFHREYSIESRQIKPRPKKRGFVFEIILPDDATNT